MVKSRSKAERIKSKGALALKRRSRQTKENDKRDGETETATTTTTNTAAAAALKGPKGLGKERKSRKREKFLTKLVSAQNNALKAKAAIGKVSFVSLSLSLSQTGVATTTWAVSHYSWGRGSGFLVIWNCLKPGYITSVNPEHGSSRARLLSKWHLQIIFFSLSFRKRGSGGVCPRRCRTFLSFARPSIVPTYLQRSVE